jgi:hypothetical protein
MGIEPTRRALPGLENKRFAAMANPKAGRRCDRLLAKMPAPTIMLTMLAAKALLRGPIRHQLIFSYRDHGNMHLPLV